MQKYKIKIQNMEEKLSDKIIANAISAYLMIFISALFLLNNTNKNIDNEFVKWHTKSAILIHLWFLITYIVFISNSLFSQISIIWFQLNNLIAEVIFTGLLITLIIWIYNAHKGLEFHISKWFHISKDEKVLDINWDWEISEKEKLTIFLSLVPFIWFVSFAKYRKNKTIQNTTRVNIIVSLSIILFYIFSHQNLANLLSLIYIISIIFVWINLFTRSELIQIRLSKYLSPSDAYLLLVSIKDYLKNYFNEEKFKELKLIIKENYKEIENIEISDEKILNKNKDFRISKTLIYIPFINLIFIFFKNTKYSFHIINWFMITLISVLLIIIINITELNYNILLLLVFPILFWIWYTKHLSAYRMPIIFDIYLLTKKVFWLLKFWTKKIKEKHKEKNEINLKIKK